MNVGVPLPVTAPPAPAKEVPPAKEDTHLADARKHADFEKVVHDEVERRRTLQGKDLPTPLLPWLPRQQPVFTDDEEQAQAISAANALMDSDRMAARAFAASLAAQPLPKAKDQPVSGELVPSIKPVQAKEEPVAAIQVVVEPNLPPVQPLEPIKAGQDVPLVQLPQAVAGTVRQVVKDNQPITQLDFQITPPHVGPVNLEVSLQDRVVSIQLVVPNIQAKQMLEGHANNIAAILQAQNLTPGPVRIVTAAAGKSGAGAMGQQGEASGFGLLNGGRRRPAGPDDMTSGSG
jgi:hypothetical protein